MKTDQLIALAYKPDALRAQGWTRLDDQAAKSELLDRARNSAEVLAGRLAWEDTTTTTKLACAIADIIRAADMIGRRLRGGVAGFRYADEPKVADRVRFWYESSR